MHRRALCRSARPSTTVRWRRVAFGLVALGTAAFAASVGTALPVDGAVTTPVLGGGSPGAGSLQAKADGLAATIDAEAARIHALSVSYQADLNRSQQLAQAEHATSGAIKSARNNFAAAQAALSQEAIAAYVGAGTGSTLNLLFSSSSSTADSQAATQAYIQVSSDNLQFASDSEQASLQTLNTALALDRSARAAVLANLHQVASTRAAAFSAISAEETALSQVKGQMAQLVVEAEAAAAANARAAAATVAHHPAPPPSHTPLQGPPQPTGPPSVGIPGPPGSLAQDFAKLRMCESSNEYSINTGNGYFGAYQFSLSTWQGLGLTGLPSNATPAEQDAAAYKLYREAGWSPWPACSAMLGL